MTSFACSRSQNTLVASEISLSEIIQNMPTSINNNIFFIIFMTIMKTIVAINLINEKP